MQQKQAWKSFRYRGKYFWFARWNSKGQPAGATQRSARLVITPTPTLTKTRVNHFEHFKENDSIQLTKQRGE